MPSKALLRVQDRSHGHIQLILLSLGERGHLVATRIVHTDESSATVRLSTWTAVMFDSKPRDKTEANKTTHLHAEALLISRTTFLDTSAKAILANFGVYLYIEDMFLQHALQSLQKHFYHFATTLMQVLLYLPNWI